MTDADVPSDVTIDEKVKIRPKGVSQKKYAALEKARQARALKGEINKRKLELLEEFQNGGDLEVSIDYDKLAAKVAEKLRLHAAPDPAPPTATTDPVPVTVPMAPPATPTDPEIPRAYETASFSASAEKRPEENQDELLQMYFDPDSFSADAEKHPEGKAYFSAYAEKLSDTRPLLKTKRIGRRLQSDVSSLPILEKRENNVSIDIGGVQKRLIKRKLR